MGADDSLPDDVVTLKAMLRAERAARLAAEAEAQARTLLIEELKLTTKKPAHKRKPRRVGPTEPKCGPQLPGPPSRPAGGCRSICHGSASSIRHLRSAH